MYKFCNLHLLSFSVQFLQFTAFIKVQIRNWSNRFAFIIMIKLLHLLVSLVCVISKIRGNNLDDHHQPSSASSWKDAKDEPKIEFIDYKSPTISSSTESVYLYDSFDDVLQFKKNWIKSQSTKNHSTEYRYNGTWDLVVTHSRIRGN